MNFDSRKRKSWSDESGVSEIIGNILILMITVVLFGSIIGFVQQMPVPENATKADFSATISFSSDGTAADLTVTHAGGATLLKKNVMVLVTVDSVPHAYYLSNDTGFNRSSWATGVSWTKHLTETQYSSEVEVTIVDLDKSESIWTSQVTGGSGNTPPMILERYVDSNPLTPTPDPVLEHDDFSLFVKVRDPDNDLDRTKVWIDSSQIEGSAFKIRHYDFEQSPGVFEWKFTTHDLNATDLDGAIIMIHARDLAGHETSSAFVMKITVLPVRPIITPGNEETPGEGGLPWYLKYVSGKQGFGIYPEAYNSEGIALGVADVKNATTNFTKDEKVFIRVASLDMSNVIGDNSLTVTDQRTGLTYTPSYVPSSNEITPFYSYSTGQFVYECKFDTTKLPPGLFTLGIKLSNLPSSGGVTYLFRANQTIKISQPGSYFTFEPTIWLFKDSSRSELWGQKTTPYQVSGGTFKIYGAVAVIDAQASPAPVVEEMRVQDLTGLAHVYGKPVAGNMLPAWSPNGTMKAYNFEIDLRYANGAQWLGGTNSYTLFLTRVSDANEGVYSLSAQVYIKAYFNQADFFVGSSGIAVGHNNFDTKSYLTYIENNNFFSMSSLWTYTNTPSDKNTYTTTALGIGDLSGDGFKDLLIAQDNSMNILYFRNSLETYGYWQDGSVIARPLTDTATLIKGFAFGDINGDNALDFAYYSTSSGAKSNKVCLYKNTYGMKGEVFWDFGTTNIRKIDLKDMNNDGKADLIVLAGGKIEIHNLVYWGTAKPTLMTKLPNTTSSYSGGIGILDFDIADMNGDGRLDILTAADGATGYTGPQFQGVWINNYTANASPREKKLDAGYGYQLDKGTRLEGAVADTQAMSGAFMQFAENLTGDPAGIGSVKVTMRFETLDTSDYIQTLVVRARTLENTEQPFYAWYSVDPNEDANCYVFMFPIQGVEYVNYTFPLPTIVAGKPIYLRFTDATSNPGNYSDQLFIDYVAVLTNQFGGYTSQRVQIAAAGSLWASVRAGQIDMEDKDATGVDRYLEVVCARDGRWAAFQPKPSASPITGFDVTDPNFRVYTTAALLPSTTTAATLFDVLDINGDGFDDILVTNYTLVQSSITQIGYYMNLYESANHVKLWYMIQELGRVGGSGAITVAVASNLSAH